MFLEQFKTVKLKKYSNVQMEFIAGTANILPGMLLAFNAAGQVIPHNKAGEIAFPMFATEDFLQGKGLGQYYKAGDLVSVWVPYRGDWVYGLLGPDMICNQYSYLESNGYGYLRPVNLGLTESGGISAENSVIGIAMEYKDLYDVTVTESSKFPASETPYISVMIM
jgi:hypothetical protein